jgi:hypothetical protein
MSIPLPHRLSSDVFYPSVTVSGQNTLRTTPTSPNIHSKFGAARTASHEQRRTAAAFALESGRAFWQLTDAMRLGSADASWVKRGRVIGGIGRPTSKLNAAVDRDQRGRAPFV